MLVKLDSMFGILAKISLFLFTNNDFGNCSKFFYFLLAAIGDILNFVWYICIPKKVKK